MINEQYPKRGDKITVGKWLKKMGHIPVEPEGKPRNAFALCKKGKFIPVITCTVEEADAVVGDANKPQAFKRVYLDTEVEFGVTNVNIFKAEVWKKATTHNLFIGALKRYQEEQRNKKEQEQEQEQEEEKE